MSKGQRNTASPKKTGLLTPQNSFSQDAQSQPESTTIARDTGEPVPKRRRSYIIAGEQEAAGVESDLIRLAAEEKLLEAQLAAVRSEAASIRSMLVGGDCELEDETEIVKPLTPISELAAVPKSPSPVEEPPQHTICDSTLSEPDGTSVSAPANIPQQEVPILDPHTYLVWFDLETTDAVRPMDQIKILEVAIRITDKNFVPIDGGLSILVHWGGDAADLRNDMPLRVQEMHGKSGLLREYDSTPAANRMDLRRVEDQVCTYMRRRGIDRAGVMAGAGVAFDRAMIRLHMPRLDALFGYQIFDTTTLWHLVKRRYNRTKRFTGICMHRAMDDINGAIREAKTYSHLILKAPRDVHWPSSNGV